MKALKIILLIIFLLATLTCRKWDNPYDPDGEGGLKTLNIKLLQLECIIDGNPNDEIWSYMEYTNIIEAKPLNYNIENNFSAQFKMCYDNNNIFLLVNVHDNTPKQVGTVSWQSDCVELFFAMETQNRGNYKAGDWQFRKQANLSMELGGVDIISGILNGAEIIKNSNFYVAQSGDVDSYIEWRIPIPALTQGSLFNGKSFRFDIQIADNSGGTIRNGQLFWNAKVDDLYAKIQNQGLINLEK